MSEFNKESRKKNIIRISIYGSICNVIKLILSFAFRTFFIRFLSVKYLGLNALFSNVLLVLSLTELGFGTAISYRLYGPISKRDICLVGKLMNYYKKVYLIVSAVILSLGLMIMPFCTVFLSKSDELPNDVNIHIVFLLFVLNSASSYLFSYRFALLSADQREYLVSIISTVVIFFKYCIQLILLVFTHNYTLMLISGIIENILLNYIASLYINRKYDDVFRIKEKLSSSIRKEIFHETCASAYHKIGSVVLRGTDNIVLTKMVNLIATGIYSNYAMITQSAQTFITLFVGNNSAVVGNALQNMEKEKFYDFYKKLDFITLWIVSIVSVIIEIAIDDFLVLWIGPEYKLEKYVSIILCLQFYINLAKTNNYSFISASGLFIKDKIRPLIEATLNLIFSIILTYYFGIIGVFIGTIVSMLLTVSWRQPIILYKNLFNRNVWDYWKTHIAFLIFTCSIVTLLEFVKYQMKININWSVLILEVIISFILANLFVLIVFHKKSKQIVKAVLEGRIRRLKKIETK